MQGVSLDGAGCVWQGGGTAIGTKAHPSWHDEGGMPGWADLSCGKRQELGACMEDWGERGQGVLRAREKLPGSPWL